MSADPDNLIPMPKVWTEALPPRREALWLKEGKVCHWCGCPTRLCVEPDDDQATIEHIIPRYKGGTNEPENLTSACRSCNGRRAYEDARNMKEGALLGKWPMKNGCGKSGKHIALTGDEKKEIMAGVVPRKVEDVMREQRDQALAAAMVAQQKVEAAKEELRLLRKEHAITQSVVREQEEELKILRAKGFWKGMRRRLADWIAP